MLSFEAMWLVICKRQMSENNATTKPSCSLAKQGSRRTGRFGTPSTHTIGQKGGTGWRVLFSRKNTGCPGKEESCTWREIHDFSIEKHWRNPQILSHQILVCPQPNRVFLHCSIDTFTQVKNVSTFYTTGDCELVLMQPDRTVKPI